MRWKKGYELSIAGSLCPRVELKSFQSYDYRVLHYHKEKYMVKNAVGVIPDFERGPKQVAESERRSSRRCKITQMLRVRPSDPEVEHFEEIRGTTSLSRSGVYFKGEVRAYQLGMRLFVTLPYSDQPTAINREYLAEVVRLDKLDSGLIGVGIKLLMDMGFKIGSESAQRGRR
jgi:hypothetical protein